MAMANTHTEVTCQSYTAYNSAHNILKACEAATKKADDDLQHMQQDLKLTVKILTTTTHAIHTDDGAYYIITMTLETKG